MPTFFGSDSNEALAVYHSFLQCGVNPKAWSFFVFFFILQYLLTPMQVDLLTSPMGKFYVFLLETHAHASMFFLLPGKLADS